MLFPKVKGIVLSGIQNAIDSKPMDSKLVLMEGKGMEKKTWRCYK